MFKFLDSRVLAVRVNLVICSYAAGKNEVLGFFFFKKLMNKPVVIHFESKGKQLKGNGSLRFLFTVLLRTGSMEKSQLTFGT